MYSIGNIEYYKLNPRSYSFGSIRKISFSYANW